jgi:hypothetical protein
MLTLVSGSRSVSKYLPIFNNDNDDVDGCGKNVGGEFGCTSGLNAPAVSAPSNSAGELMPLYFVQTSNAAGRRIHDN